MYDDHLEKHGIDYLFRKDVNKLEGIKGKIKTIYEDFHVHEITKNNNILHLNHLINKKKINKIIEDNEKTEERSILQNVSNPDLHLDLLSKYMDDYNRNVLKKFLNILFEIYQLKMKTEKKDNTLENIEVDSEVKKITIPYCILSNLDDITMEYKNSVLNNFICENNQIIDKSAQTKIVRKNIHNLIKQCYPFLLTETKNASSMETVISHGNILDDNFLKDNLNIYLADKKANLDVPNDSKMDIPEKNVIEVYPSLTCLKTIFPKCFYNKLKSNTKKYRSVKSVDLEKLICERLGKMEDLKRCSKKNSEQHEQLSCSGEAQKKDLSEIQNWEYTISNYSNNGKDNNDKIKLKNMHDYCDDDSSIFRKKRKVKNENSDVENLSQISYYNCSSTLNILETNQKKGSQNSVGTLNVYKPRPTINSNEKGEKTNYEEEDIYCDNTKKNDSEQKLLLSSNNNNNGASKELNYNHCNNGGNVTFLDNLNEKRKKKSELKKEKKFLHFNLYKENKDICEILNKIKINFKKKNADISYCGIKDKRGITVQKFCIHNLRKEDIFNLIINNTNWCNNVYISNLEYKKYRLSLGDLKGNFFKILIRGVDNDTQEQYKILSENLKKFGFVNYYGYQRFGSKKIKNYEIGICILKKNYKQALFYIIENAGLDHEKKNTLISYLNGITEEKRGYTKEEKLTNEGEEIEDQQNDYSCREMTQLQNNKNQEQNVPNKNATCTNTHSNNKTFDKKENIILKKKNIKNDNHFKMKHHTSNQCQEDFLPKEIREIINSISNHSHVEKTILRSLKNNKVLKNAFMTIPKDIFSLFIHATQSLIFNILVNIRMKKYGFKVIIGDLIEMKNNNREDLSSDQSNAYYSNDSTTINDENLCEQNIVMVTQENISLYDIYDVVLPLPGDKNTIFPHNLIDDYKEVLHKFNLSLDDFKSEKGFFTSSGCYRKIVVKPHNFKSFFIKNNLNNLNTIPFIKSDLHKLLNEEKKEERERPHMEYHTTTVQKCGNKCYDMRDSNCDGNCGGNYDGNCGGNYDGNCGGNYDSRGDGKCYGKCGDKCYDMSDSKFDSKCDEKKISAHCINEGRALHNERDSLLDTDPDQTDQLKEVNVEGTAHLEEVELRNEELEQMEEHLTFIAKDFYHDHLIKEIPNYQTTSSIFLMCTLPKSSYITVALMEVLNN
ncbi:conserved Plasmodium protein, unknown function [Plasmodium malariae]|uniref:TRUD domain-containing protein n=1 Tax=Plasmodium malariae TaxID=5858 RepID=A0A1A8VSD7_PLAMA|nr:conserved Plasmodium protein, unknown function [Plasmodium malariae]